MSDLVGRERELAQIAEHLTAALGGAGRALVCSGEPGIGKSSLARAVADRAAARGVVTVWGQCIADEPYSCWAQVVAALSGDAGNADLAVLAPGSGTEHDRHSQPPSVARRASEADADRLDQLVNAAIMQRVGPPSAMSSPSNCSPAPTRTLPLRRTWFCPSRERSFDAMPTYSSRRASSAG